MDDIEEIKKDNEDLNQNIEDLDDLAYARLMVKKLRLKLVDLTEEAQSIQHGDQTFTNYNIQQVFNLLQQWQKEVKRLEDEALGVKQPREVQFITLTNKRLIR